MFFSVFYCSGSAPLFVSGAGNVPEAVHLVGLKVLVFVMFVGSADTSKPGGAVEVMFSVRLVPPMVNCWVADAVPYVVVKPEVDVFEDVMVGTGPVEATLTVRLISSTRQLAVPEPAVPVPLWP